MTEGERELRKNTFYHEYKMGSVYGEGLIFPPWENCIITIDVIAKTSRA